MTPTANAAHPEVAGSGQAQGVVPKWANRPPQFLTGILCCILLWGCLLGLFSLNTSNQFGGSPIGDATYFAEMTQSFYTGEAPAIQFPAIHSRRILGPWLAGKLCLLTDWIEGRKPAKPFHYSYHGQEESGRWPVEAPGGTYSRIISAWQVVNAAAFLGIILALFGIFQALQPKQGAALWQPIWLALILGCSPTLGRLYFIWPLMNDLVGISLGLLALLCLLKRRVIISGVLFGAAMLARENLALIYPCFLWILFASERTHATTRSRKSWLFAHFVLSFAPYILICVFPVFRNIGPLEDAVSHIQLATAGASRDYWALILFHLGRPFTADHALLRQASVYWQVLGPLLFLVLRFYPWKRATFMEDRLLWAGFLLAIGLSFYVDRYVVYAVFPLALLARHCLRDRFSPFLAVCLSCFYLEALLFFTKATAGQDLQVEFVYDSRLKWTSLWGACALLLVLLEPILRARPAPIRTKTTLDRPGPITPAAQN
jgi:hypothetical protein